MYNPEFVLENETHKLLWDFEIQTDHLISARRPDLQIVSNKENLQTRGHCRLDRPQRENKRERKER